MLAESLRIALRALGANKLRTALTMLGIVIGVGAVIALLAIGQGASAAVEARFSALGSNVITIVPGTFNIGGVRSASGQAQTLSLDDAEALEDKDAAPAIAAVTPERFFFGQLVAGGLNTNARIIATSPSYQEVYSFFPERGEFFTQDQVEQKARVIVLGKTIADNLFGESDPIGQTIRVNAGGPSANLRVIGVMQPKGGTGFQNRDEQVMVPISTGLTKLQSARNATGGQTLTSISIKATSSTDLSAAQDQLASVFNARRKGPDAYQIRNLQDQIDAQKEASNTLTILLGAIAGISLVVGGIGIMNIMIVSVTERTREIGIRKAIGAKRKDILLQFLMEAMVVSIAGGILGILAGVGTSELVKGRSLSGQQIQTVVAPASIMLAFGVSVAIGLFFGIYPASRASRLNPIEALRYE